MRTLLHVSDLHFGRTDPLIIGKLLEAILQARPDIVIISGDLTQRASIGEFKDMQAFLGRLDEGGVAYFVIPGNHDIRPFMQPIARATKPYDRYREYISQDIEPRFSDGEVAIAAIDTVRREKFSNGRISLAQVERVQRWFSTLHRSTLRIVVTHHPLALPARRYPLALAGRARKAVYRLASSRIDLYLSGHYHRSSVTTTREEYEDISLPSIAVQAGTVSLRDRGEAQSFNMIAVDGPELCVETYHLRDRNASFEKTAANRFIRERGLWRAVEAPLRPRARTP